MEEEEAYTEEEHAEVDAEEEEEAGILIKIKTMSRRYPRPMKRRELRRR